MFQRYIANYRLSTPHRDAIGVNYAAVSPARDPTACSLASFVTYRRVINRSFTTRQERGMKTSTRLRASTAIATALVLTGLTAASSPANAIDPTPPPPQLNASTATTTSVAVGCTSPSLPAGRHLVAYPIGTSRSYRILRSDHHSNGTITTLSAQLTSFHAENGFFCTVS
jgi:hypothetical protein